MGYALFRFAMATVIGIFAWILVLDFLGDLFFHRVTQAPWRSVDMLLMTPGAVVLFWWVWKMVRDVTADTSSAVNAMRCRLRARATWRR